MNIVRHQMYNTSMKYVFLLFSALLFHLVAIGQAPEPHEVRFRLYNESGELLTRDSLQSDTLNLIEFSANFISYDYDSASHYHIVKTNAFYSNLALHWVRNEQVMDLLLVPHDTIARKIEYCSLDRLQFEEGQFTVRVRTNSSPCETYEVSKSKFFEHVVMYEENSALHLTWESLEEFKANPEDWCTEFSPIVGHDNQIHLECP